MWNVMDQPPRSPHRIALAFAATLVAGCGRFASVDVPVRTIEVRHDASARAACLVVMLPGMGDEAEDYVDNGFAEAVIRAEVGADVVAVNAHYGYYRRRIIIDRLHEDVLAPARRAGYARIVILGISMGGVGAVAAARLHPDEIDAVFLLAPYMGSRDIAEAVVAAGGLAAWRANDESDFFEQNWTWLRGYADGSERPPLFIGYGASDRLAPTLALVTPSIDETHVSVRPGDHGWRTWRPIFEAWAGGEALREACAVSTP